LLQVFHEDTLGSFQLFQTFTEIFASQGAPPVSTTPVANFASGTAGVADTGGKFETILMLFSGAWRYMIHEKN
jgi:hypothetical protein